MAKYEETKKFIARTHPKTALFENGGHLITGHGDAVSVKIKEFIGQTMEGRERRAIYLNGGSNRKK